MSVLRIQQRLFRREVSMKVKARSPISWLQHDSVGECGECADPMLLAPLTWPPSQHNSPVVLKGCFNMQKMRARAYCAHTESKFVHRLYPFNKIDSWKWWKKKKKNQKHGTAGLTAHFHTRPLTASTRDHNRVIYFPNITAKFDIVLVRFWLFQLPVAILFSFTSFHWWEIFWKTSCRSWENSLLFWGIIQHVAITGNWSHPKCSMIEAAHSVSVSMVRQNLPKINPARYTHFGCQEVR